MPKADLGGEKPPADELVVDVLCPSCGRPSAHHESSYAPYDETMTCRLSANFVRRVGTMDKKELHGGTLAAVAGELCRWPDHNADIATRGSCGECGSNKRLNRWSGEEE